MNRWYRIRTFVLHYLTAWNTGGEGVHSPNLFQLVRYDIYDNNQYYAFAAIEKQRRKWLKNNELVQQTDFGAASKNIQGETHVIKVRNIASGHLEQPKIGQLLFRIVNALTRKANRPLTIVELGTSLGITTAYLATPSANNNVITLEGANNVIELAEQTWKNLAINNIRVVRGNIDSSLTAELEKLNMIDFAFIDANHTEKATLRYFNAIAKKTDENSIVVIDDIYHSPEMTKAWDKIKMNTHARVTIDLWSIGIVLFNPHYEQKHYKMRY